jgi:hypothetical protein
MHRCARQLLRVRHHRWRLRMAVATFRASSARYENTGRALRPVDASVSRGLCGTESGRQQVDDHIRAGPCRPSAPASAWRAPRLTEHPTAAWTSQQLREAFPWDRSPRYLLRDRDHAFHAWANTATAMDIQELLTAPRSPWQNAYVERFIGSVRRECLDHVLVFNATGLQRLMKLYCTYYERSRSHLSLNKDTPIPRPIAAPADGRVVAIPQVGGLHHRYERRAA